MGKMRPRMSKIKNRMDEIRTELFRLRKVISKDIKRLEQVNDLEEFYTIYDIALAHCEELESYARLIRKGDKFLDVIHRFHKVANEKYNELQRISKESEIQPIQ